MQCSPVRWQRTLEATDYTFDTHSVVARHSANDPTLSLSSCTYWARRSAWKHQQWKIDLPYSNNTRTQHSFKQAYAPQIVRLTKPTTGPFPAPAPALPHLHSDPLHLPHSLHTSHSRQSPSPSQNPSLHTGAQAARRGCRERQRRTRGARVGMRRTTGASRAASPRPGPPHRSGEG